MELRWHLFFKTSKSHARRGDTVIFTGSLDEDSPGARSCEDVRFYFLLMLEIVSEPEAASRVTVVAQQMVRTVPGFCGLLGS